MAECVEDVQKALYIEVSDTVLTCYMKELLSLCEGLLNRATQSSANLRAFNDNFKARLELLEDSRSLSLLWVWKGRPRAGLRWASSSVPVP